MSTNDLHNPIKVSLARKPSGHFTMPLAYKKIDSGNKIKLCFLGCGNITAKHARTLNKYRDRVELGFASRSLVKAEDYSKKYRGLRSFGSYEEAIKDPWPDVVMINLPPVYHYTWAEQSLQHDKHIILEKPPLLKSEDFDSLMVMAEPRGLQIMVAENYYYKPVRNRIKELIHSGLIGEPRFIHISSVKYQEVDGWRDDEAEVIHGALYEGGIHWISFIRGLGFDIAGVQGYLPSQQKALERSIQVVFKTKSGPIINLLYSWEIHSLFKGLRFSTVHGTDGSIRWESNGVLVLVRGKKNRVFFPGLLDIDGKAAMFQDFIEALYAGEAPMYSVMRAKEDLGMIENIYSSLEK